MDEIDYEPSENKGSASKMEIVMASTEDMKRLGIQAEATKELNTPVIHNKADEKFYNAALGPAVGKAVFSVVAGRNRTRVKAFENKDFQIWFESIYKFVEKRAAERGYFTTDVEFSKDSGITRDGNLLLRLVPKPGARRLL